MSSRALAIHRASCWLLVVLGVAHGAGTLVDAFTPAIFRPSDPAVLEAMRRGLPRISALMRGEHMTLWRLHLGCSISSALGFALTGAIRLRLARIDPRLLAEGLPHAIAITACALWAAIGAAFWFWIPSACLALATVGLASSGRAPVAPSPSADRIPTLRLLVVGASIIGLAGGGHGLVTLVDIFTPMVFSPVEASVRHSMEHAAFALPWWFGAYRSTWDAFIGFNLAHGVSTASFALTAIALGRRQPAVVLRDRPLCILFAAASLIWMCTAVAFWFWAVIALTTIAAICLGTFALRSHRRMFQ